MSPAVLTPAQTTQRLRSIGFRIRSTGELQQAIGAFKTGWLDLGPTLLVNGKATAAVGPLTSAAIDLSYQRRQAGQSTMSPHFSFTETECHCGGQFSSCRRIWPTRASVVNLEKLRAALYPNGLAPVSWCRCTGHNKAVGGATSSRHLVGDAVDIPHRFSLSQVLKLRLYTAMGVERSDGNISHVDNRPGSTSKPVLWYYGG